MLVDQAHAYRLRIWTLMNQMHRLGFNHLICFISYDYSSPIRVLDKPLIRSALDYKLWSLLLIVNMMLLGW